MSSLVTYLPSVCAQWDNKEDSVLSMAEDGSSFIIVLGGTGLQREGSSESFRAAYTP